MNAPDSPFCTCPAPLALPACPTCKPHVFHLKFFWQDTLLELIRLHPGTRQKITLPNGHSAYLQTPKPQNSAQICILEHASQKTELPLHKSILFSNGCSLHISSLPQELRKTTFTFSESRFLHTLMLVCAAQICWISTMVMVPEKAPDPHPGGGISSEQSQRYVRVSASKAPKKETQNAIANHGRPLHKAEQALPYKDKSATEFHRRKHKKKNIRLAAFIHKPQQEISGTQHGKSQEPLGEAMASTAQSQALGAGFGGILAPKEILHIGIGNGDLGTGTSRIERPLPKMPRALKRIQDLTPRSQNSFLPAHPLQTQKNKNESVPAMDPRIFDHLTQQMRHHRNAVRYCYETWGLTAHPAESGRITLQLTLHPSGEITDVHADTSKTSLEGVRHCVEKMARNWYLGDRLVTSPQRLRFPFTLRPRLKKNSVGLAEKSADKSD